MFQNNRKKSSVWTYFSKRENTIFVRCNLCHNEYKSSGNTSNLFDHLRRKHQTEYKIVKNDEYSDENEFSQIIPTKRRKTLKDFLNREKLYDDNEKKKVTLDHLLVSMIATDLEPFTIVEHVGFKNFVHELDKRYELPSRFTLKCKLFPELYEEQRLKLFNILNEIKYLAITTDMWTSPASEGILTVTCHFIYEKSLRSAVLTTQKIDGHHTGVNISKALNDICSEWKILNKIVAVLSDSGANIVNAVSLLQLCHLPCFAHNLNLLVTDLFKDKVLQCIIQHCKDICAYFRHSTLAMDKLRYHQQDLNMPKLKVLQETPTRWNSMYDMLKRLLEIRYPVTLTLSESYNAPPPLGAKEINIIEELLQILLPFKEATTELSGDSYVTISIIIPIIVGLIEKLNYLKNVIKTEIGLVIIRNCEEGMKKRLLPYETRTPVRLATILDPRIKKLGFRTKDQAEEAHKLLVGKVTAFVNCQKNLELNNQSTESRKEETVIPPRGKESPSLLSFLDMRVYEANTKIKESSTADAVISVKQYIERPPISRQESTITFWCDYQDHNIKEMALKYLCVPATSVPSERVFSKAGLFMTDRRTRIKPKNLDKLIFLRSNSWLNT